MAAWKPGTTKRTLRDNPCAASASSIGPWERPRRDVRCSRETPRRYASLQQRMSAPHHRDETVAQQRLHPDLRANAAEHANIEIDAALAQSGHIFFVLVGKSQRDLRRFSRRDGLQ
jgi:hypothetical protein